MADTRVCDENEHVSFAMYKHDVDAIKLELTYHNQLAIDNHNRWLWYEKHIRLVNMDLAYLTGENKKRCEEQGQKQPVYVAGAAVDTRAAIAVVVDCVHCIAIDVSSLANRFAKQEKLIAQHENMFKILSFNFLVLFFLTLFLAVRHVMIMTVVLDKPELLK